jgi:D-glycero-alpha-D-manno-heptose-7-phosphate kinase
MIMTRTPFRISFAGGGSDLPSFYREEPGMVISAAISKYMYLVVKQAFANTFRVSYSQTELRKQVEDIQHPIVRECLKALGISRGLEIVSVADMPAQTGMGSSSSFAVGLLAALHAMHGRNADAGKLARQACDIEINKLREPIGKQDQYIAAYGGIQFIQFMPDGDVFVDPVICSMETKHALNQRLLLFYTGRTREARTVLERQNLKTAANRAGLRELCRIAVFMRDVLRAGHELKEFGELLHEAWRIKRTLESSITSPEIDELYERGIRAGALGGKLLGAGGGGFLLFFCEPEKQEPLRRAMAGAAEIQFAFEPQGSKIIYVGEDQWSSVEAPFSTVMA